MVIARYFGGFFPERVGTYLKPVYGTGPDVIARMKVDNPADLLASTDLRPGELAIYANYPCLDHFNFDAQVKSFVWLAAKRGVAVDLVCVHWSEAQPLLHRSRRTASLSMDRGTHP